MTMTVAVEHTGEPCTDDMFMEYTRLLSCQEFDEQINVALVSVWQEKASESFGIKNPWVLLSHVESLWKSSGKKAVLQCMFENS